VEGRARTAPDTAFKRVAQTARASYFSQTGHGVDVERSEAFLRRLATVFGPAPRGSRLAYYRYRSPADMREHTGLNALGVTDIEAGRIDSALAFHPHELVHAVAGRLGRAPVLFEEGLAVALTSGGRWGTGDVDGVAKAALASGVRLEPFLEAFAERDPEVGYPLAGSFVAYLLDTHGIDALIAFFVECGASPDRYEPAFRRAFGRSLANARLGWRVALASGRSAAAWSWNDPATWPGSLKRDGAATSTADGSQVSGTGPRLAGPLLLGREP
jgi:hypothetical protein